MKKITIILLTVFYFAVASGITVSLHYCGGKFKEFSLFHSSNEEGCCGSKKKSKGCCNEKTTVIKVKDNHNPSNSVYLANNYDKIICNAIPLQLITISSISVSYYRLKFHSPPVLYDNPLYLKHKALLI
jgi:hypothetical protein